MGCSFHKYQDGRQGLQILDDSVMDFESSIIRDKEAVSEVGRLFFDSTEPGQIWRKCVFYTHLNEKGVKFPGNLIGEVIDAWNRLGKIPMKEMGFFCKNHDGYHCEKTFQENFPNYNPNLVTA